MSTITPEEISAAAGILLSLGFSYIPGVQKRFAELDPTHKRLVMLGLLLACALCVFGLSCAGPGFPPGPWPAFTCDRDGAWELARVFVAALIANQAAFSISPRLGQAARQGKQARKAANPAISIRLRDRGGLEKIAGASPAGKEIRVLKRPPSPGAQGQETGLGAGPGASRPADEGESQAGDPARDDFKRTK
jgi:hypothetical protein